MKYGYIEYLKEMLDLLGIDVDALGEGEYTSQEYEGFSQLHKHYRY